MSRTGVDVRKIKNAEPGKDLESLARIASYGDLQSLIALAHLIKSALYVKEQLKRGEVERGDAEKHWGAVIGTLDREGCLERELKNALRTKSGAFFLRFAKAIECMDKGLAPAQAKVMWYLWARQQGNEAIPSVYEMEEILEKNGTPASVPSIRKYYRDADVQPPEAKRGAPRGKRLRKSKTPHRVK